MQVQVTLISREGRRPLSTLIEVENWKTFISNKEAYQHEALLKILAKRHMSMYDLRQYGYATVKCRPYDRERIAKENAERYKQIKKERGWK